VCAEVNPIIDQFISVLTLKPAFSISHLSLKFVSLSFPLGSNGQSALTQGICCYAGAPPRLSQLLRLHLFSSKVRTKGKTYKRESDFLPATGKKGNGVKGKRQK